MALGGVAAVILPTVTFAQAQSTPVASVQIPGPPLTVPDRFRWVALATLGPKNLAAGVFVAGIRTWRDEPEAYGPHWDGFAKRYGARLAAGGTSNALEGVFGGFWGEDPHYYRAVGRPLNARIGHVVKMAFVTHNKLGNPQPAYARYIAVPGGVLISNTWRPDSPYTAGQISFQVGMGFLSRIIGNAFSEFTPDLLYRKHGAPSDSQGR